MTDKHLTLEDLLLASDFGRADPARVRALIEAEELQNEAVRPRIGPLRPRRMKDEECAETD